MNNQTRNLLDGETLITLNEAAKDFGGLTIPLCTVQDSLKTHRIPCQSESNPNKSVKKCQANHLLFCTNLDWFRLTSQDTKIRKKVNPRPCVGQIWRRRFCLLYSLCNFGLFDKQTINEPSKDKLAGRGNSHHSPRSRSRFWRTDDSALHRTEVRLSRCERLEVGIHFC